MPEKIKYSLFIATANIRDAGTDATVKVQLIGEKGKSPEIELNKPGNDFEQGDSDIYDIEIDDIGDLQQVRFFHDNGGAQPGWCLGHLAIRWMKEEGMTITTQWWSPELGNVTGTALLKVDGSLFGLPQQITVTGVWLARDSGGIDKTFPLRTDGRKEHIIPLF